MAPTIESNIATSETATTAPATTASPPSSSSSSSSIRIPQALQQVFVASQSGTNEDIEEIKAPQDGTAFQIFIRNIGQQQQKQQKQQKQQDHQRIINKPSTTTNHHQQHPIPHSNHNTSRTTRLTAADASKLLIKEKGTRLSSRVSVFCFVFGSLSHSFSLLSRSFLSFLSCWPLSIFTPLFTHIVAYYLFFFKIN